MSTSEEDSAGGALALVGAGIENGGTADLGGEAAGVVNLAVNRGGMLAGETAARAGVLVASGTEVRIGLPGPGLIESGADIFLDSDF